MQSSLISSFRIFSSFPKETLYTIVGDLPSAFPTRPLRRLGNSWLFKFASFGYFFNKKPYNRWSFVTVLLYLVCFQSSSVLKHVSVLHSFVCWIIFHYTDVLHYVYAFIYWWTFVLFTFLAIINNIAMNIGVNAFCVDLCFLFLMSIYLGIELLNHTIIVYLAFWETFKQLSKNTALF